MRRIGRRAVLGAAMAGLLAAQLAGAGPEVPATNPLSGDPAAIKEGESWFRAVCSFCHGPRAEGTGRGGGPDLRVFNKGFQNFVEIVKNGRDVPGRAQKMPAWRGVLPDDRIYQIGAYLETLARNGANWR